MKHKKLFTLSEVMMEMPRQATIADVKKHIRYCLRKGKPYNWLGFVETRDIAPSVEDLFSLDNPTGGPAYNWVSGNSKLKTIIKQLEIKHEKAKQNIRGFVA